MSEDTKFSLMVAGFLALIVLLVLSFVHVAIKPLFGERLIAEDMQKCRDAGGHLTVLWIQSAEQYYVRCEKAAETVFEFSGR